MSTIEIEKRLTAIERELAHLKEKKDIETPSHPIQVLEKLHGKFENDKAFREAARLGRQWRNSQAKPNQKRANRK